MKTLLLSFGVLFGIALGGAMLSGCGKPDDVAKGPKYHCPMHPTYVSDRPGDCPICGMRLVPIKGDAALATTNTEAGPAVAGRISVMVPADKRQLIGLSTSVVETRALARHARFPAVVVHDERRLARIAPRFAGWVRSLQVNYTGQDVEKGQPLFTAYSPELFTTENEYLLALRNYRLLTNSPAAERASAENLVQSARRRLELMQVGEEEIRSLEQRGQPSDEILLRAPFSGHVVSKTAVEGRAFAAGETLYEIADLQHLWVNVSVYEQDLQEIQPGQKAIINFPALGDRKFETSVSFINPHLDPQTRRAEVRLELDNPDHVLRPDMWGNAELELTLGNVLAVPASAVLDSGTRYLAFVDRPDQHLEPRQLKIGAKADDYWQVLEGLKAGEKVVTRALFLVDSESQLKAAISGMGAAGEHQH